MKKKNFLGVLIVAAIILGLGAFAYFEFFGGAWQFDAEFYEVDPETTKPFSYDDYAFVLKNYVDDEGLVNYSQLKSNRNRLDYFVRALANLDSKTYESWGEEAKIAFWINAYNALALKVIVDNYPIESGTLRSLVFPANSIRQIPGVWDKIQFLVMGEKVTLGQVEHEILRKEFDEPRIHMALVCAALGCPQLRNSPFKGEFLDAQLLFESNKFLSNTTKFKIDRDANKVYLSSIFKWFGGDFEEHYLPKRDVYGFSLTEAAVIGFVKGGDVSKEDAEYLKSGKYEIEYLDYDWTLNEQNPKSE